jgi:hypothetical protein
MDDEIDVAPIDAEVEGGSGDDTAQAVLGHCLLDLAALADIERTVMERDRQTVGVDLPQFLEQQFGLAARVDEQQRRPVGGDRLEDFADGIARRMAGPRHALARFQDRDFGLCPDLDLDDSRHGARTRKLRHEPLAQLLRLGNGRRQPDGSQARPQPEQVRERQR